MPSGGEKVQGQYAHLGRSPGPRREVGRCSFCTVARAQLQLLQCSFCKLQLLQVQNVQVAVPAMQVVHGELQSLHSAKVHGGIFMRSTYAK